MKKYLIFIVLLILLFTISSACAQEPGDNSTLEIDNAPLEVDTTDLEENIDLDDNDGEILDHVNVIEEENDSSYLSTTDEYKLEDSSDVIVVKDWDELKLYAGKTDKNYVLKLKENANFYPKNTRDSNYQIVVRNNLTVIGSEGAYIGGHPLLYENIQYTAIYVSGSSRGINFENITFKYIGTQKNPDGVFLQMTGYSINKIKNCRFENINTNIGHSCIVYLERGYATLENCSFINCTTDYGAVSVYDENSVTSAHMTLINCYFENNYARTEPGCINNCGIVTVYNTTFIKNRSYWWAGAIHTHIFANTTVYNSKFIDNVAGWNGGALYTYSYLTLINSSFIGNNCTTNTGGGAIGACSYSGSSPSIYIEDCLFKDNTNTNYNGNGGAISAIDNGGLQVYNSTFIHNSAARGTAIYASAAESYGSPTVFIEGNTFINHTQLEDVLRINLVGSGYSVSNNTYINNAIPISQFNLNTSDPIDKKINVSINFSLMNSVYYDEDILSKCTYDIYIDGKYVKSINSTNFTINFEDIETCSVYVVPSIYSGACEEITLSIPRNFIYVSKEHGDDNNDGKTKEKPVYSLSKAIELARLTEHIFLIDGTFNEENLIVDYRLTIWGTNKSLIGLSTIQNCMFNVNNAKLSLRNLTISDIMADLDNSKLISANDSRIFIENCIVKNSQINILSSEIRLENNIFYNDTISINTLSSEILNTTFNSNKLSMDSCSLIADNSTLINNTAYSNDKILSSTSNGLDWKITNSKFSHNKDINSCLIYHSSDTNKLKMQNIIFENNEISFVIVDNSSILSISSSIFRNNNKNSPIINKQSNNSIIIIENCILLNNSKNNQNGIISGDYNNINCNYNWWGNTINDSHNRPNLNPEISLDNWLVLNISYPNNVEYDVNYTISFSLDNLITIDGACLKYNNYGLPPITLQLIPNNVNIINNVSLINGKNQLIFSLINLNNGMLEVNYETVNVNLTFNFIKTDPQRTIVTNNILIGQDELIKIILPKGISGNLTVTLLNSTQTRIIDMNEMSFNFTKVNNEGNYTLLINYSGDERYDSFADVANFSVSKYEPVIKFFTSEVVLYGDVNITIQVPEDATGNISLYINGIENLLEIKDSKATYTIYNITRGDWNIEAKYNGDSKYKSSTFNTKISVAKYDASILINLLDIYYMEDANVEIIMNSDATGNITVSIDDKIKTEELKKGRVTIVISNLTCGQKNVKVHYTGDEFYNEQNISAPFFVEQIPLNLNITTKNAKEGNNVIVELAVAEGIEGVFTLSVDDIQENITIPYSGNVIWEIPNLNVGKHVVHIVYNGQNYLTRNDNVDVFVYPWNDTQWPNEGFDGSGQSPYSSNVNGEIKWVVDSINKISKNIAIDDEGNIYIINSMGIWSYDKDGKYRWNYTVNYGNTLSGISIGREVIIAPASGDTLYFINQTSGKKIGSIYQGSSIFSPVVDKKANIYITSEQDYESKEYNLVVIPYRLWGTGGDLISISIGKSSPTTAPVVVNGNIVCIGTEEGLKLIDVSQKTVISTLNIETNSRPVVGDGGIIYTITSEELIALDVSGNQIWKSNITAGEAKYLAIDNENGFLYAINTKGNLYKYNILDNVVETLVSNLNITSGVLIGNDGILYFGLDSTFMALDSNGKYLWKSEIGKTITGTPAMDENGNIYITGNNTLFALTQSPLKEVTLNIDTANVEYGNDVKITVNLNKEATGNITIEIDDNNYSCMVNDGLVEFSIPNLSAFNYNINVSYTGDKRFSASNEIVSVNVTKKVLPASDIVLPSKFTVNNPTFSINLPTDATGTLTVSVDGNKYSKNIVNGKATLSIPKLTSGSHKIIVTYSGDNNYAPITTTKTVNIPLPKITNNKNVAMDYNDGSYYKVRVIGSDGNPVAGEYVTFKINKKSSKVKTNKNGYASLKITEIPKTYKITANYNGIIVKNTVKVKQILKSSNYKVKKSAKKLIIKATLKTSKGKAIKGKQITFKLNGKTLKAKTNKKGIAKVTFNKKVIKKLKANKKYAVKITYIKDTINKTVAVKK